MTGASYVDYLFRALDHGGERALLAHRGRRITRRAAREREGAQRAVKDLLVMSEYPGRPGLGHCTLRDVRLHTGDLGDLGDLGHLGHLDSEGHLYPDGRLDAASLDMAPVGS